MPPNESTPGRYDRSPQDTPARATLRKFLMGQGPNSARYRATQDAIKWFNLECSKRLVATASINLMDAYNQVVSNIFEREKNREYFTARVRFALDIFPVYMKEATGENFSTEESAVLEVAVIAARQAQEDFIALTPHRTSRGKSSKRKK